MKDLLERYPKLVCVSDSITLALELLKKTYRSEGKLLLCGNGGSASDCDHIVGELMKSFKLKRPIKKELSDSLCNYGKDGEMLSTLLECGLPALSLCEHNSLSTAYANDRDSSAVFAQQLFVYGKANDTLIALTTSGNSKNCILASIVAKALNINVISITGAHGGEISAFSDVQIKIPETETYLVQELTLPVYHFICAELEKEFF